MLTLAISWLREGQYTYAGDIQNIYVWHTYKPIRTGADLSSGAESWKHLAFHCQIGGGPVDPRKRQTYLGSEKVLKGQSTGTISHSLTNE